MTADDWLVSSILHSFSMQAMVGRLLLNSNRVEYRQMNFVKLPSTESIFFAAIRHRGVISTFSWGPQIFFFFFNATGLLKNWKKHHFICSNLTLFIVPFFFFSLSFFLSFFLFLWGRRPPSPLKWRPWSGGFDGNLMPYVSSGRETWIGWPLFYTI